MIGLTTEQTMPVSFGSPDIIAAELESAWGHGLSRAAQEALAIESFRAGKLSIGQLAEWLGLSIDEADGLLKSRGVVPSYSSADLDRDLASLRTALANKRPKR